MRQIQFSFPDPLPSPSIVPSPLPSALPTVLESSKAVVVPSISQPVSFSTVIPRDTSNLPTMTASPSSLHPTSRSSMINDHSIVPSFSIRSGTSIPKSSQSHIPMHSKLPHLASPSNINPTFSSLKAQSSIFPRYTSHFPTSAKSSSLTTLKSSKVFELSLMPSRSRISGSASPVPLQQSSAIPQQQQSSSGLISFEINSFKLMDITNNSTFYFNETIFKPLVTITTTNNADNKSIIKDLKFKYGYYDRYNTIIWLNDYSYNNEDIYFKIPYFGTNNVTLIASVIYEKSIFIKKEKTTTISLIRRETDLLNFVNNLLTFNSTNEIENAINYLNDISDKLDLEKRQNLRNNIIENIETQNNSTKSIELLFLNTLKKEEINEKTTILALNLTSIKLNENVNTKIVSTLLSNLLDTNIFNTNVTNDLIKITANNLLRNSLDKLTLIEESKLLSGQQLTVKENNFVKVIEKNKIDNLNFNLNSTLNLTLPINELTSTLKQQYDLTDTDFISVAITKLPIESYSFEDVATSSLNSDSAVKCVYFNEKLNKFKDDGVTTMKIDNNTIKCSTNHLTDFTITTTIYNNKIEPGNSNDNNKVKVKMNGLTLAEIAGITLGCLGFIIFIVFIILSFKRFKKLIGKLFNKLDNNDSSVSATNENKV